MIIDTVRGDIIASAHKHIAFAVNAEGDNDAGFSGLVLSHFWPELASTGGNKLGDVISKRCGDRTFHALVCYDFYATGWTRTPELVQACLDRLDIPDTQTIGIVLVGSGMVGQMGGADVYSILGGIARSNKRVVIHIL